MLGYRQLRSGSLGEFNWSRNGQLADAAFSTKPPEGLRLESSDEAELKTARSVSAR